MKITSSRDSFDYSAIDPDTLEPADTSLFVQAVPGGFERRVANGPVKLPRALREGDTGEKPVTRQQRRERSQKHSVLFDAPGPKAMARIRVANAITVVLAVAVLALIVWRFAHPPMGENQLSWKLWEPALNARAWLSFYIPGALSTLAAAAVSIVGAVVFGFVFALGRLSHVAIIRWVSSVIIEFCRAVPVLLFMIFFWRVYAALGFSDMAAFWAVVTGLVLYNGSVVTELIRSGVGNLPLGQAEAATALGMSHMRSLMSIEIPQAVIASMPALVAQLVVVLKDTALGSIISYADLLQRSRQLGALYFNSLQTLFVAAVFYFVLCYWLTRWAQRIPEKMQSKTSGVARSRAIQPEAILDPDNITAQETASRERPFGGVPSDIPDHYHGSNAVRTRKWEGKHRHEQLKEQEHEIARERHEDRRAERDYNAQHNAHRS